MSIPDALLPFTGYRQFITYTTRPSTRPGKLDKLPTDWRTGAVANAHDPSIWTDWDTANAHGAVGFVFTEHDPFWFLDIDNCLTPSGWSPLALELCAALPGAAVEVSISGTGLHVFGVGTLPRHKTKNSALGLELYHSGRFVALGSGAQGNAMTNHTGALAVIVAKYFAHDATDTPDSTAWSDTPVPEWIGPTDDDDLIRRACQSKSAAGAFGGKATFQQLWDADFPALCKAYPDTERGYDASSADAALAQHLAFWTGKDCERIADLMQRSALKRPKWVEHPSYIRRTVEGAVAQQNDVCKDKPPESAAPVATIRDVHGETYLSADQMKVRFAGCTYVGDIHSILVPNGAILNEGRFNALYGGFTYMLDQSAGKQAKTPWQAFLDSKDVRFPKVDGLEFDPRLAPGAIWQAGNRSYVNSYVPVETARKKGNPKPFLDHLARILPDQHDRDIMLAYMAAVVQHPGVKFQWAPLIQGAPGNGKTMLSRVVAEAVGREYCHIPRPKDLANKFNAWMHGKIFIGVEDIVTADHANEVIETLEALITNEWLEIEGKGSAQATRKVCANFILNCNPKDGIRKRKNDRRFAVFYTKQQSAEDILRDGMGGSYFPDLYAWLKRDGYAIVTDYLKGYSIPDALNPATDCHRAPITSSTAEAVTASVGRLEQEIINAIEQDHVGFRNGWVSSHFLDALIVGLKLDSKYPRNKRTDLMLELGYFPHPGLVRGQVNNVVTPDGSKPRLYIMAGHPAENMQGAEVARRYSEDQVNGTSWLKLAA